MVSHELKLVPCSISRGAFSGERIVEITRKGFAYRGAVPVLYCFNQKQQPLDELTPPKNDSLKGLVRLFVVRGSQGADVALAMPDGTILTTTPEVAKELEV
jgi:hypothetical protein